MKCPIDGEVETISHTLTRCTLLKVAFDTISKCFPLATASELPELLLTSSLALSFQSPIGFLTWSAIINWKIHQRKTFQQHFWTILPRLL